MAVRVIERLEAAVEAHSLPPQGSDSRAALHETLHIDDLYNLSAGAALDSFDLARLRVTKDDLNTREIEDLISPAAKFIRDPFQYILKSDEELARDVDRIGI